MSSQATWNCERGQIIVPPHPPGIMITLPGQGTPALDCGHDIPMHCNHCGHTWIGKRSCMGRTCPNCWRKWAMKEGRVSALRLWGGVSMIAPKRTGRRIVHAVVSFITSGELSVDRKRAITLAKKHGLSGGTLIFHPFRQDDEGTFIPQTHVHFHIISLARGSIVPSSMGQDYFFKFIKDARNGDYRGFQDITGIRNCITYLLTHCGIIEGSHALTWWGELSYNQLSNQTLYDAIPELKKEIEKIPISRCPSCGSEDTEPDFIMDYTSRDFVDCRPGAYG